MITEKKLQSIYFTEVTKKNILGGLDKLASRYEKVYGVIYDGGSVNVFIDTLSEVVSQFETFLSLDEDDKEDLTNRLLSGEVWRWEGFVDPNHNEAIVSSDKNEILQDIVWRSEALQEAQTKIANG